MQNIESCDELNQEYTSLGFNHHYIDHYFSGVAAELLKGCPVKAIAVVGFPLGASTAKAKAFETLEAIRHGAGRRGRRRMREDFTLWCKTVQSHMETVLLSHLPAKSLVPHTLHEAMHYAVLDGGKRVRPLLTFAPLMLTAPSVPIMRALLRLAPSKLALSKIA